MRVASNVHVGSSAGVSSFGNTAAPPDVIVFIMSASLVICAVQWHKYSLIESDLLGKGCRSEEDFQ